MAIPSFSPEQVEQIARCVADARSHAEFTELFNRLNIDAPGPEYGAKWRRIRDALLARQNIDQVGNNIGAFIQAVMAPICFVDSVESFVSLRESLNKVLAFSGLAISESGQLGVVKAARTLREAEARANELREKLLARDVHFDVLTFCHPELLEHNYFHAVLEATKSVASKIRQKSGLSQDGAELVQRAFGGKQPYLAINRLSNETEVSEQKGFANLVVGLFGTFRNPTAHAPRIEWPMSEADALDLLTLVSYIHRRLDAAACTHYHTMSS